MKYIFSYPSILLHCFLYLFLKCLSLLGTFWSLPSFLLLSLTPCFVKKIALPGVITVIVGKIINHTFLREYIKIFILDLRCHSHKLIFIGSIWDRSVFYVIFYQFFHFAYSECTQYAQYEKSLQLLSCSRSGKHSINSCHSWTEA